MVSINKQGNALVIEFTDNDKYLFDGIIEVAPNELMVVIDKSDMATFKKASNGDVLFSQLISDIQIAGSPVTKDTIIDQFAAIGFISGGGGSGEGAVSSVNGQTGDVIITPASLNVYTRVEVDDAINEETTERQKQDSALGGMIAAETAAREQAVASKQDTLVSGQNIKTINGESVLGSGNIAIQGGTSNWDDIQGKPEFAEVATSGSYNDLTDKPEIPSDYIENITDSDTEFSIDTAFNYKSGKKYSLSFSKTGGFDVVIGGVGDTQRNINLSIDTDIIATKEDLADYQPVGDYATKTELASKQDTLVSGTNIKTVNGQSLLGNGNIDITSGGTITVDSSLSTTSENPVQNKVITNAINGKQDAGDYALKSEIPDVSGLATKAELAGKQDTLTAGAGIKIADNTIRTINNVQQAKIIPQSSGFIFNTISVDNTGNPSIVNAQLSNTKDQDIRFEPDSSNPSTPMIYIKLSDNIVRKTVADETYATKQELAGKLDTATYNSEKADFETKENAAATYQVKGDYATKSELAEKQDTLVSGTNIKTINGNSILGEGDITVSGGGTVDDALSTTSENPVQNKVLTDILQGNSVKLGKSASTATGGVSIGANANSNSNNSVVIGSGSTSSGISGVAIGYEASDSGGVAIGKSSKNLGGGVVIGQNSQAYSSSVILGDNITDATGHQIIIGYGNPTGNIITLGMDSTIYWYVQNTSKKTYIRKSDGTYIDVEDSVMTSEEKSKLANTPTFWTGTQTEYDAIQTKDENTYYFIKEG